MTADLRQDRRTNRQAEFSATEHATGDRSEGQQAPLPGLGLEGIIRRTVARGANEQKAFDELSLNSRGTIKLAVAMAGLYTLRLDKLFRDYVKATKGLDNPELDPADRKKLDVVAEVHRLRLAECRRTVNVAAVLNAQLLKAGKTVHDGDLDRFFSKLKIEGTENFDSQCEGDEEDLDDDADADDE